MYEQMEDVVLRYEELMRLLSSPGAADDSASFKRLMKEQGDLAPIVEVYKAYKTAQNDVSDAQKLLSDEKDPDMIELEKEELSGAKERLLSYEKQLQIFLLPKDKNDDRDVVLEIRAGAGGEEAALFASDLYRMYQHYIQTRGWSMETDEFEETGIGGFKHISFTVRGTGVYSVLKYESGVHRVQRVPETESGYIHRRPPSLLCRKLTR